MKLRTRTVRKYLHIYSQNSVAIGLNPMEDNDDVILGHKLIKN